MKKGIDYTGVAVIYRCHDGQGNFLMMKRSHRCRDEQGTWEFGGGGVKFTETPEEALVREMKEEYGVAPETYKYLGHESSVRDSDGSKTHWIIFRYAALVNRSKVQNMEPEKADDIGWFALDELPQPLHSEVVRQRDFYISELKNL